MVQKSPDYDQVPIKSDTKAKLTAFKEVAGMTYDEAVDYLLLSFLKPEDEGSIARAGLRVRESLAKDDLPGNQKGLPVIQGSPMLASVAPTP